MKVQHLDLLDKVEHWRRRDNVRKARDKVEENRLEAAAPIAGDAKAELRRRAAAAGVGVLRQAE